MVQMQLLLVEHALGHHTKIHIMSWGMSTKKATDGIRLYFIKLWSKTVPCFTIMRSADATGYPGSPTFNWCLLSRHTKVFSHRSVYWRDTQACCFFGPKLKAWPFLAWNGCSIRTQSFCSFPKIMDWHCCSCVGNQVMSSISYYQTNLFIKHLLTCRP